MKYLKVIAAVLMAMLNTCIDPYYPQLKGYESIMVVDGLISDENRSYTIKISRTIQDQNTTPHAVSDATVFISDDAGNKYYLQPKGSGLYKTDSLEFRGYAGRT